MGDIHGVRVTPAGVSLDSIVICDNTYDQITPAVAASDSIFLVCWNDRRDESSNIYCARVLGDGTVIEKNGFSIFSDSTKQITPVVSFGGTNFLVIWAGYDLNGYGIYGARVSKTGVVLDSTPIIISRGSDAKYNPDLSFDGNNYMVIWDDARVNGVEYDEWAARISKDGILLDTNGIAVDTSWGSQFMSSIAYVNPYYLGVWTDDKAGTPDIFGKHISSSGIVMESTSFPVCNEAGLQVEVSCFAGVDNYLVAWNDGRLGYENTDIYGAFVDTIVGIEEKTKNSKFEIRNSKLTTYPNPFSQKTVIEFRSSGVQEFNSQLSNSPTPQLTIYDACGRVVRRFPSSLLSLHSSVTWNGRNEEWKPISAGIYFCHLKQGKKDIVKKILLVK